jgi:hypothetical protein
MFVIVRDDPERGTELCSTRVVGELADANAILRTYQLEFPHSSKVQNPRIMELQLPSVKLQLVESLRIEEVPGAER